MPAAAAAAAAIKDNTMNSIIANQDALVQEDEVDLEAGLRSNNTKVLHTLPSTIELLLLLYDSAKDDNNTLLYYCMFAILCLI
jgi:hypothetical protein